MTTSIVLTGGPCSGKTTTIAGLMEIGFDTVPEIATTVIQEGVHLPWVDPVDFRKEVLTRQFEAERYLSSHDARPLFLDRGVFDGIGYSIASGQPVPEFLHKDASGQKYSLAFLMEPLPYWSDDGVRYEDRSFSQQLTPIMETVYKESGIEVIRVPFMSMQERICFILSEVRRREPKGW